MFNLIFIIGFALLFWRDPGFWGLTTLTIVATLLLWTVLNLTGMLP